MQPFLLRDEIISIQNSKGREGERGVGGMKEKREGGRRKQRGRKIGKDRSEREGGE